MFLKIARLKITSMAIRSALMVLVVVLLCAHGAVDAYGKSCHIIRLPGGLANPARPIHSPSLGGIMSSLKVLRVFLALCALPLVATAQQPTTSNEIVDKVLMQEQSEIQLLRQYSPVVETYIQYFRLDKQSGAVPDGDKYFLGRARLANGVQLEPLEHDPGLKRRLSEDWREFLSTSFVPGGFLQMIYLDTSGFDRQHYRFD
jgi:hypothetical protein